MTTALITHDDCLQHVNPPGHPESVARLRAVGAALADMDLLRIEAPLAEEADILRAHPQAYIDALRDAVPAEGDRAAQLDPDTYMSAGTLTAAYRGVGGIVKAVDMVLGGEAGNAFCALRPPGHHAETATAMGFCIFGNIAIAAKHALAEHGLERVAILDFDVHHGNGTQDLVWNDAGIRFVSTHQMPLYPGTGSADETGAHGNILNIPLKAGDGGEMFRRVMEEQALPFLDDFAPELVLVSAGFDAHARDPLANLMLVEEDFAWATQRLCDLADSHCAGKLVSTLEGGYDLEALAASTAAHVTVLRERGR